ncbi:MAG: glycosyltransferase, partial [Candidatus Sumerlaeia bacterium]|nr:glycosyltransferase [Candidatus Sumerlaeia bacterium]
GGHDINDWKFGLMDKERAPKPALETVSSLYTSAPQCVELPDTPKISVVVATYNGGATLRECLGSLTRLDYPFYEVIVIDDGSTDNTSEILADFPMVRIHSQENKGLSVARNMGIHLAEGEIIAFTDSDCVADPDWLYFIALTMLTNVCVGVGGPNLTPWEKRPIHRTVAHAPGHATHVLLDSHEAEHVPGCNMAFWRSDLVAAGSFDPIYRKAGDDVDIIWRLQENGGRMLFSPAAFVWHHRRSTIGAYLKQQMGYGEAEALLAYKHPQRFNDRGQSLWRGVIYSSQEVLPLSKTHDIHYGVFGSAGYQCIYERRAGFASYFVTSVEWWLICALLLVCGSISFAAFTAGALGIVLSIFVSGLKARRQFRRASDLPGRFLAVVWFLWLIQPLCRGWKRYTGIFLWNSAGAGNVSSVGREPVEELNMPLSRTIKCHYWNENAPDRLAVLRIASDVMKEKGWLHSPNTGWDPWDLSIILSQSFRSRLVTAEEDHGAGRKLFKFRLSIVPTSLLLIFALSGIVAVGLIALQDTVLARILLIFLVITGWILFRRAMKAQAQVAALCEGVLREMGYFTMGEPNTEIRGEKSAEVTPNKQVDIQERLEVGQ